MWLLARTRQSSGVSEVIKVAWSIAPVYAWMTEKTRGSVRHRGAGRCSSCVAPHEPLALEAALPCADLEVHDTGVDVSVAISEAAGV